MSWKATAGLEDSYLIARSPYNIREASRSGWKQIYALCVAVHGGQAPQSIAQGM